MKIDTSPMVILPGAKEFPIFSSSTKIKQSSSLQTLEKKPLGILPNYLKNKTPSKTLLRISMEKDSLEETK